MCQDCALWEGGKRHILIFYRWIKWKWQQQHYAVLASWFCHQPCDGMPFHELQMHKVNREQRKPGRWPLPCTFHSHRDITTLRQEATEINSFLGLLSWKPQLSWRNSLSLCHLWFLSLNRTKARFNRYWLSSNQVHDCGVWTWRVLLCKNMGKEL